TCALPIWFGHPPGVVLAHRTGLREEVQSGASSGDLVGPFPAGQEQLSASAGEGAVQLAHEVQRLGGEDFGESGVFGAADLDGAVGAPVGGGHLKLLLVCRVAGCDGSVASGGSRLGQRCPSARLTAACCPGHCSAELLLLGGPGEREGAAGRVDGGGDLVEIAGA